MHGNNGLQKDSFSFDDISRRSPFVQSTVLDVIKSYSSWVTANRVDET